MPKLINGEEWGLNREKLVRFIISFYNRNLMEDIRNPKLADAIISSESELLEKK